MRLLLTLGLSLIAIGPALARSKSSNETPNATYARWSHREAKLPYREWVQIGEQKFSSLEEAQPHQRLVFATFPMLRSNSVP